MKQVPIIISLGGSIVAPKTGIDAAFIRGFVALLARFIRRGHRFVIVVGGGATARQYRDGLAAVRPASDTDLDWMGLLVTHTNAHLLRLALDRRAAPNIITRVPDVDPKILKRFPILISGGERPGQTTDAVAVGIAMRLRATRVINISNVDALYDRDPKLPGARPLSALTWVQFGRLFTDKHRPGANVPFDPVAARRARTSRMTVAFVGADLANLSKVLDEKPFQGTVVTP